MGYHRPSVYYAPRVGGGRRLRTDETRVRSAIREVAFEHISYGYRPVWAMLRRRGFVINPKRVHRLRAVEGLSTRPLPAARLPVTGRLIAERPNERW